MLIAVSSSITAQELIRYDSDKKRYFQGDEKLNHPELLYRLRAVPQAWEVAKKARTPRTLSHVVAFTGGLLVGYELGALIFDNPSTPNSRIFNYGGGVVLVLTAIVLEGSSTRKMARGVELYNESIMRSGNSTSRIRMSLSKTRNGIGITFGF